MRSVAQRAGRDAPLETSLDLGDVALRLGHLRAAHLEMGAVEPGPDELAGRSPPRSGRSRPRGGGRSGRPRRCGCRSSVPRCFMLIAEHSMCQPGPALADARRPGRLAWLRALPEREVADVVLVVLVGLDPLADPELRRVEPGQLAVGRPRGDPEEDRAFVRPVGVALVDERLDERRRSRRCGGSPGAGRRARSSGASGRPPGTARSSDW